MPFYKINSTTGLTLIELLIVMAVIAVAGVSAVTATQNLRRRTLQNAALTLQADIRWAQRNAMIEGRRIRLALNQSGNNYALEDLNLGISHPQRFIKRVEFPPGVNLFSDTGGLWRYEFLPRGTPGFGGAITLRYHPFEVEITVLPASGRVEIKEIERIK